MTILFSKAIITGYAAKPKAQIMAWTRDFFPFPKMSRPALTNPAPIEWEMRFLSGG
jgi:hypothetical protein